MHALDAPFAAICVCMRVVPHLQPGESIAHCPTLTRSALIILTLFCKTVPQLCDCSPYRDNRRFSVLQSDTRYLRAKARRGVSIFFFFFVFAYCIIYTHGAFIWLPESNTRISKYCEILYKSFLSNWTIVAIWTIAESKFLKKSFQKKRQP